MKFRFHRLMNEDDGNGNQGGGGSGGQGDPNNKGGNPGDGNQGDPNPGDGGQKSDDPPGPGDDGKGLSLEDAQKIIKDLRAENAKYRTEKNNISSKMESFEGGLKKMLGIGEDDDSTPEEKVKQIAFEKEQLELSQAMLSIAYENGIGKDDYEYFEFLMSKKLGDLEEGQELSEEDLDGILGSIKLKKAGASTSTSDGGEGKPPKGGASEVTQEEFDKMGITAKSLLYQTKPDLYNKLAKNIA